MARLKDINWGNPIKAVRLTDDNFDEMYGAEVLEISEENILDLIQGKILYVVVEGEYAVLMKLKIVEVYGRL